MCLRDQTIFDIDAIRFPGIVYTDSECYEGEGDLIDAVLFVRCYFYSLVHR